MNRIYLLLLLITAVSVDSTYGQQESSLHDFSSAQILAADQLSEQEQAALDMLVDEIEARTTIRLPVTTDRPPDSVPVIVAGTRASSGHFGPFGQTLADRSGNEPEGFSIAFAEEDRETPAVLILGNDARGMLYGIGYFLRKAYLQRNHGNERGRVLVPGDLSIETWPEIPLRGHQLGYRPKTNSYTGWDTEIWEQYIRDLAVFGTNAVELIPPNTDDREETPMFPLPQTDMMVEMNNLLIKYSMDTWIWYPLMHGDYSRDETIQESLEENETIFSLLKQIDALFIPGGDPGDTPPDLLFDYLERQADLLHRYHPDAEIWVSPQSFDEQEMELFLQLAGEEPEWLTGIVYGPQVRLYVDQLRERLPDDLPIRRYPDITHTYDAQYPVANWDLAFAATQNREPINPRPVAQKEIFHAPDMNDYHGFLTYSEGINDDVNKIIWSGLGWDPDAEIFDILSDYSRYFIGNEYVNDFSAAVLDLENNWKGPLLSNSSVKTTYQKFKTMEENALPDVRMNWRFLLTQFRAHYDEYLRNNLIYETRLEEEAMEILRKAPHTGSMSAMDRAEEKLNSSLTRHASPDIRERLFELAEALFQTIRMKKSVDKYFATDSRRGANLDLIDWPLNNRRWLNRQFMEIREMEDEDMRLAELDTIINWTNPGPGGYYTDLGDLGHQPNVTVNQDYETDPAFLSSTFVGFAVGWDRTRDFRTSWARYMQTLYDQPLQMHYTNLNTSAVYEIEATYLNQYRNQSVRLIANGEIEVHPYIEKDFPVHHVTYDVPREATETGELTLEWIQDLGMGGTGRGNQLGEVWLRKKSP